MPFFQAKLLPNNQPEIHLGYFKANTRAEALKKARRETSISDKDCVYVTRIKKEEILDKIDDLVEKSAKISNQIYDLVRLIDRV